MEIIINNGRKFSFGLTDLCLYAVHNNIHIMDNHRAAIWSWVQHIKSHKRYQFIHIDRHYDTVDGNLEAWIQSIPSNFSELSIDEAMNIKFRYDKFTEYKTISWDNYIPIFYSLYKDSISNINFFTHKCCHLSEDIPVIEMEDNDLINKIDKLIISNKNSSILNIDLDYFFTGHEEERITPLFSIDEIKSIFEKIKFAFDKNKIEVITIALSPSCCGEDDNKGWKNSLDLYDFIAPILGLDTLSSLIK